jgi:hypothetical protein
MKAAAVMQASGCRNRPADVPTPRPRRIVLPTKFINRIIQTNHSIYRNTLLSQFQYIIPSREEILGLLRTTSEPQDSTSLAKALGVAEEALDGLTRRLNAMERDGQIKPGPAGQLQLANMDSFIEGKGRATGTATAS